MGAATAMLDRIMEWIDQASANRFAAVFSVSNDTDPKLIPDPIEATVAKLPFVLQAPDPPDCELRGFGESAVDVAVEHRAHGLDDGRNRSSSPVWFAIWNTLKDSWAEMSCRQPVVAIKGMMP